MTHFLLTHELLDLHLICVSLGDLTSGLISCHHFWQSIPTWRPPTFATTIPTNYNQKQVSPKSFQKEFNQTILTTHWIILYLAILYFMNIELESKDSLKKPIICLDGKDAGQKSNVIGLYKVYVKIFCFEINSKLCIRRRDVVMKRMAMGAGDFRLCHCVGWYFQCLTRCHEII